MNRLFTRIMWIVAAILVCVVCGMILASGHSSAHAVPTAHPATSLMRSAPPATIAAPR